MEKCSCEYDSETGVEEFSNFYHRRVFLPNVYGANGLPGNIWAHCACRQFEGCLRQGYHLKMEPGTIFNWLQGVCWHDRSGHTELVNAGM